MRNLMIVKSLILLALLTPHLSSALINCDARCGRRQGGITVNLQQQCMCLPGGAQNSGSLCFKIDIGKDGPSMTTSGRGKTHDAEGAKYQTLPGAGTTGYDKDAIATGIAANDGPGKWIHKTRGCSQGGNRATKGCIGVPCDVWPLVKAQKGQEIEVCGSEKYGGTSHMSGAPNSAETPEDGETDGKR